MAEESAVVFLIGGGGPFLGIISLSAMIAGWLFDGKFSRLIEATIKQGGHNCRVWANTEARRLWTI